MEAEVYSLKSSSGGHRKACVPRSPAGHWLGYTRTENDNYSNTTLTGAGQTIMFGIGIMAGGFILKIAVIKVIAPRFEETSAKIKEKMVRSTEVSACARLPARGGCMLPLVPELALLVMTQVGVRMRGDVVKSLYYVCGGMRHQVTQLLVEQDGSKPSNHNRHNYKENYYKNTGLP